MTKKISWFLIAFILSILMVESGFAAVDIPGGDTISQVSIGGGDTGPVDMDSAREFGLRILSLVKLAISGLALVFIVMIGAYMVYDSGNEENIKKQKRQILYTVIGFLFLNIPTVILSILLPGESGRQLGSGGGTWSDISGGSVFWNSFGLDGFIGNLVAFLRVLVFGLSVLIFTWGAFEMIISRGLEDKIKQGRNRILYGVMGLLFLGFVEGWARWVAAPNGDLVQNIVDVGGVAAGIAFFFMAPTVVFFLIVGAYYYIMAAGDEERAKKGKKIIFNTLIATLILIASLSFLNELVDFLT